MTSTHERSARYDAGATGPAIRWAREHGPGYEIDPADPGPTDGTPYLPASDAAPAADDVADSLRDAILLARHAMERVRTLATTARVGGGEVGGLLDLLHGLDAGQAAAATLVGRVQRHGLAPRSTGLTLEAFLAVQSPLPGAQRRALLRTATALEGLPQLASAVARGVVPAAALTAITAEARSLDAPARDEFDRCFADEQRLARLGPEELVVAVRDVAERLAPAAADRDKLRPIEDRFLSLQPRLDGSLTGYFELDAESGATLLEAIESAAPPPSAGPKDVTAHGHDGSPQQPVIPDAWARRSRGRQRADGLVRLAEDHLAGTTSHAGDGDGDRARRARPRFLVLTDIATLTGHDALAGASRLLWAAVGRAPSLTPAMVRRLASDADLQLVLHDDGEILGITEPTARIPVPVRSAVLARDRGCRFPGCEAPPRYLDLHHVQPREKEGPTVVENLVGLCRRHHTAVTQGRWRLTMTPDGVVTVRRGQRIATSDPPHRRRLAASDPPDRPRLTGSDPPVS